MRCEDVHVTSPLLPAAVVMPRVAHDRTGSSQKPHVYRSVTPVSVTVAVNTRRPCSDALTSVTSTTGVFRATACEPPTKKRSSEYLVKSATDEEFCVVFAGTENDSGPAAKEILVLPFRLGPDDEIRLTWKEMKSPVNLTVCKSQNNTVMERKGKEPERVVKMDSAYTDCTGSGC